MTQVERLLFMLSNPLVSIANDSVKRTPENVSSAVETN
ncbi:hypothetical protein T06_10815, partial [Trichinella sp. T6]